MEISHASSETQSAAVGIHGKAEEVRVSTDAEFMMMLAHGIYSNKALALVRELICNARDGHIRAGKTDTAIHIALTDNLLVIRDFGTGIPNEIFAPTYMIFGASTKRKDKTATGGFGVGTKVPWAVCDVFSARNYINGTMTAYSIVKMDPALDGKPSCTPVMELPTTESSGVEVSVPFPEKMRLEIYSYIVAFANELNIKIRLNDVLFTGTPNLNHDELKAVGYTHLGKHPKTVIQRSFCYVRQGDVIYPIEPQDEFQEAYDMIVHLAQNKPMLFMAEPDSIIPTLSRESLQYTERTSKSILTLMKKALQVLVDNIDSYAERVEKLFPTYLSKQPLFIQEMWSQNSRHYEKLTGAVDLLHDSKLSASQNFMLMSNIRHYLRNSTPYLETKKTIGKDFRERFKKHMDKVFINKLKVYTYFDHERLLEVYNEAKRVSTSANNNTHYEQKLKRHCYEELMFFQAELACNPDIFDVYFPRNSELRFVLRTSIFNNYLLSIADMRDDLAKKKENIFSFYNRYLLTTMYLSNTVVISNSPAQMVSRALEKYQSSPYEHSNIFSTDCGRIVGARCVRVRATLKPDLIDQLKKKFESYGYDVVLLTEPTEEELAEKARLAELRTEVKDVSIPMLHELIYNNISTWTSDTFKKKCLHLKGFVSNKEYAGEPLYYMTGRGKELSHYMSTMDQFINLAKFVGTNILAVSTKTELNKAIKEGRRPIEDAVMEIAQWFYTKPGMHEKLFYQESMFSKLAEKNKYLTRYLFNRIPPEFDKEEQRLFDGLQKLRPMWHKLAVYMSDKERLYNKCGPEEHYNELFAKYADRHFCDVHRALEKAYSDKPSPKRAIARKILKTILKERPT